MSFSMGKRHTKSDTYQVEGKISKRRTTQDEGNSNKKKREYSSAEMISWLIEVAKKPRDPKFGSSGWQTYENEHCRKELLMLRESRLLLKVPTKMHLHQNLDQYHLENFWAMHPSMYENEPSELPSGADYFTDSTTDVRIGWNYQANVPEDYALVYESDSKWLGSRVYPAEKLAKPERNFGRNDNCVCEFPGSMECINFHIAEERFHLIRELGPAFYDWKFDSMGEESRLSWTKQEEDTFKSIVDKNMAIKKPFWESIYQSFPYKSKKSLINYYWNAFVLNKRAYQNRHTPMMIDTDDEM